MLIRFSFGAPTLVLIVITVGRAVRFSNYNFQVHQCREGFYLGFNPCVRNLVFIFISMGRAADFPNYNFQKHHCNEGFYLGLILVSSI